MEGLTAPKNTPSPGKASPDSGLADKSEPDHADENQVDGDDENEYARHNENEDAGDERDDG